MIGRAYQQVDVFTTVPFRGNPVAVVLDAEGLDTDRMQQIANWTNLSETTFVLPSSDPAADYRVRIFTPQSELPFAGHPTIGTAHALLEAGRVAARDGALIQQCEKGRVELSVTADEGGERTIAFALPPPVCSDLTDEEVDELQAIVGCELERGARPRLVDVGPRWIVAQLPDAGAVIAARPDLERMARQDRRARATGVVIFGPHEAGGSARVEVRAFAPSSGIGEDQVCGSGNGCMAVYLRDSGQVQRFGEVFVASQGQVVGRDGRVRLAISPDRITVGGSAVTCIDGSLRT